MKVGNELRLRKIPGSLLRTPGGLIKARLYQRDYSFRLIRRRCHHFARSAEMELVQIWISKVLCIPMNSDWINELSNKLWIVASSFETKIETKKSYGNDFSHRNLKIIDDESQWIIFAWYLTWKTFLGSARVFTCKIWWFCYVPKEGIVASNSI